MAEWKEIYTGWTSLVDEVDKMKEREVLTSVEGVYLRAFAELIKSNMHLLEELESDIGTKGVHSPDPAFRDDFKRGLDAFYSIAKTGLTKIGGTASELQDRLWQHGIIAVTSFLERKAGSVGVDGWSIGVTAGLPAGVSAMITVNFKK